MFLGFYVQQISLIGMAASSSVVERMFGPYFHNIKIVHVWVLHARQVMNKRTAYLRSCDLKSKKYDSLPEATRFLWHHESYNNLKYRFMYAQRRRDGWPQERPRVPHMSLTAVGRIVRNIRWQHWILHHTILFRSEPFVTHSKCDSWVLKNINFLLGTRQ